MAARQPANEGVMFDDSPHSVVSWLDQHSGLLGFLFGVAVVVAGWILTLVRYGFRLTTLETDQRELAKRTGVNEEDLCEHITNTRRHIDPERDERRWQELREHLARIEAKVERRTR